jgi:4-carboxymuconolactone decarboxylase/3-oxoadipate enol-lactonase/4-carboxymuconolactone decarboxylase
LRIHARAALGAAEGRLSVEELVEILLQQAVYCGVPTGNAAFESLREVLGEAGDG